MRIDITGYITETHGKDGFKIKITGDTIGSLSYSDIQVSKEVSVHINKYHYPSDYYSEFEKIGQNESIRREIAECRFLCDALRAGDRVGCAVFIVDTNFQNDTETHIINSNHRDIKAYAEFYLWLYPNTDTFKRLEVDSRESLKFRKQWRYVCINREKCGKITGYAYKYRSRRWINKNPTIILPIIGWIWIKTAIANLWKRLTRQENPPKTIAHKLAIIGIVVGVISIVATVVFGIISIAVAIWF